MTDRTLDNKKAIRPICGKIIRTMDNNRKPCLREENHEGGCNPFSDTKPMVPTERNK